MFSADQDRKRTDHTRFVQLLRDARGGCRDATGELIERYRNYLLLIASHEMDPQLKAKMGPSDAVQNTLAAAQNAIGNFRGGSDPELVAWLRQILLHDLQQNGRRFRDAQMRDVAREVPLGGDSRLNQPPIDVSATTPTPSEYVEHSEERDDLYQAMSRLSAEQREVLYLRNWQQLSFAEIGEVIGRTAEATRKVWSRAVTRMQHEMRTRDGDP